MPLVLSDRPSLKQPLLPMARMSNCYIRHPFFPLLNLFSPHPPSKAVVTAFHLCPGAPDLTIFHLITNLNNGIPSHIHYLRPMSGCLWSELRDGVHPHLLLPGHGHLHPVVVLLALPSQHRLGPHLWTLWLQPPGKEEGALFPVASRHLSTDTAYRRRTKPATSP